MKNTQARLRLSNSKRNLALLIPMPRHWRMSGRGFRRYWSLLGGGCDLRAEVEDRGCTYGVCLELVRKGKAEVSPRHCDWVAIMPDF